MVTTRRRGPYAKTSGRQRRLSEIALRLVEEKGHRNVTVSEIARMAGVSEPAVFYHFPTKESLLLSALKQHDDHHIRSIGHEAGAIADMGHRAEIGVRRENVSLLYAEMSGAAADHHHPANAYLKERWARSIRVVSTDIRRLQSEGLVPEDVQPEEAAQIILASWEGLQLQWLHGPEFDIAARLEAAIRAVLGPLALSGGTGAQVRQADDLAVIER